MRPNRDETSLFLQMNEADYCHPRFAGIGSAGHELVATSKPLQSYPGKQNRKDRGPALRSVLFPPEIKTHHPDRLGDGFLPRFPALFGGFALLWVLPWRLPMAAYLTAD
jgi:hypothetical protein